MKKNNNKSAFTIAELILTTVIMAIVCVVAPVIVLKRDVKPQKAKKFKNIAECKTKCIYDAHTSTLTYLDEKGIKTESVLDYNKNTNEFYTIILVGGGAGATDKSSIKFSIGFPGETKTIMIPTLDENKDITNDSNKEEEKIYEGILTGYYLMEVGKGGSNGKNGEKTVICTISEKMARNINSAKCKEGLDDKEVVIIDSAEGGITSNENYNIVKNDRYSSISLEDKDLYGNGGIKPKDKKEKAEVGMGGLVIIK